MSTAHRCAVIASAAGLLVACGTSSYAVNDGGTNGTGALTAVSTGRASPTGGTSATGGLAVSNGGSPGASGTGVSSGGTSGNTGGSATGGSAPADSGKLRDGGVGAIPGWTLVWHDEFDGASGSLPNSANWVFETGGNGWGNAELEYYTNRSENASLDGHGNLIITAKKESYMGNDYTSARIKTLGKFDQEYGRFESRIKIPSGQGLWPAFWLLGSNVETVDWPACGEIDIMENIGKEPSTVHGTIHGPNYSNGTEFMLPGNAAFAGGYHVFSVEWDASAIRFYVDGSLYGTHVPSDLPSNANWVYDHPFFILLNVAVGGTWPGSPDGTTTFPQTMSVDYVRVYTKQ